LVDTGPSSSRSDRCRRSRRSSWLTSHVDDCRPPPKTSRTGVRGEVEFEIATPAAAAQNSVIGHTPRWMKKRFQQASRSHGRGGNRRRARVPPPNPWLRSIGAFSTVAMTRVYDCRCLSSKLKCACRSSSFAHLGRAFAVTRTAVFGADRPIRRRSTNAEDW
jgi:hypothetical protein